LVRAEQEIARQNSYLFQCTPQKIRAVADTQKTINQHSWKLEALPCSAYSTENYAELEKLNLKAFEFVKFSFRPDEKHILLKSMSSLIPKKKLLLLKREGQRK
jgi:hypothetical protein